MMPDYSGHHARAGRIGGLIAAARTEDTSARAQQGQRGLMARFLREVPVDVTDPTEREQKAHLLLRAHMARLALKSQQKRGKRAARGRAA